MQSASDMVVASTLPARLPKGYEVGGYVIHGWVRDGGMAAIYRAHRAGDGVRVALKLQLPSTVHLPEICARFDREADAMRRIAGGPNVIELYDADVLEDDRRYFVMEWIDGEDLDELLDFRRNQDERLSIRHVCRIGRDIATGLATVHAQQLVHLDLKPANVMIGKDAAGTQVIKLVDFGIVADLRIEGDQGGAAVEEEIMGTSAYMAPEQADGAPPEPRIDLFALGVVLYEALTGNCVPPDGWTPETLPTIESLRRGVPDDLAQLVRSCMSTDPDGRPQSAAVVVAQLTAIVERLESGKKKPASAYEIPIRTGGTVLTPKAEISAFKPPPVPRQGGTAAALTHQQVQSVAGSMDAPVVGVEAAAAKLEGSSASGADVGAPVSSGESEQPKSGPSPAASVPGAPVVAPKVAASMAASSVVAPLPTAPPSGISGVLSSGLMSSSVVAPPPTHPPVVATNMRSSGSIPIRSTVPPDAASSMMASGAVALPVYEQVGDEPRPQRWWLALLLVIPVVVVIGVVAGGDDSGGSAEAVADAGVSTPAAVGDMTPDGDGDRDGDGAGEGSAPSEPSAAAGQPTPPSVPTEPEASVASRPSPVFPEAEVEDDEPPEPPRKGAKGAPRGPSPAECEARRDQATAAKTGRNWPGVLKATSKRACWSGGPMKLERRRLRVEAYAELGNFERCVKEGGNSSDREIGARVNWCQKRLG